MSADGVAGSTAAEVPPVQGGAPVLRGGWALAALAVGQVASWGVLYYGIVVAAPAVADQTGWPLTAIMLGFSTGLTVSAVAGIPVGRWLDERGPRSVMVIGAVVAALGLVLVAAADGLLAFAAGWAVVGLGQSAVLYQAAFTVIARRDPARRRRSMTVVTLAGGVASTVFAPVVVALLGVLDWRGTLLALAVVLLVVTLPLHLLGLERRWPPHPPHRSHEPAHRLRDVLRTRRFWMLEAAMVALAAALFSATLALIPLLAEKGLSYELAAWALGLLGAGQVIGRLLHAGLPHRAPPWVPLATTSALAAGLLALLGALPGPPWLLVLVGVATGAVRGAQTLVQGSAVADRWGTRSYGAINGAFAAPITIVMAAGPALGPAIAAATGSYGTMALVAAALAVVALVLARFA